MRSWIAGLPSTLVLSALLSGFSPHVFGGAFTDGSVGPARSFSGSGDSFTVPEAVGTLKGSNLFHSFARFSVAAAEAAKFTTTTGSIRNVISRVTGGEPSVIHGLLALEAASGSRPDFYLVNPSGVIFGAGAQVNVPAGLHVSTAQQLKFADGFVWNTTAPTVSALTAAPPEAFGFVGPSAAAVTFHNRDAGGIPGMGPSIQLSPNSTLSISGGAVQFDSADAAVSQGGQIRIAARGDVSILNGSLLSSRTSSDKAAGSIDIDAAASLFIDRGQSRQTTGILSETTGAGDAGQVTINVTEHLSILNGEISSETQSAGSAGLMDIQAGAMTIDGRGSARGIFNDAGAGSVGETNLGRVHVDVTGELTLLAGGQISSSTISLLGKPAGSVDVEAGALMIDARNQVRATGIFSAADTQLNTKADAGRIRVNVDGQLSILNGAEISSSSHSGGAGTVDVRAGSIAIGGFRINSKGARQNSSIASIARATSSGQPGSVSVATHRLQMTDSGRISIENEATESPSSAVTTTLIIDVGSVNLTRGGEITAASQGTVPASTIDLNFADLLVLRNAKITTSATDGNGGEIRIRGGRGILLDQSQVTTSVSGTRNGNGGDITIRASVLALDTGFIQANTDAIRAMGGNVLVDVDALLPSGSALTLGGNVLSFGPDVFALNVIQAAAPEGVSGRVDIAVPALDIAGHLAALPTELIDVGLLGRDFCGVAAGSSLTPLGQGGLRPTESALIRPEGGYALTVVENEDSIGFAGKEIGGPADVQLTWACY